MGRVEKMKEFIIKFRDKNKEMVTIGTFYSLSYTKKIIELKNLQEYKIFEREISSWKEVER